MGGKHESGLSTPYDISLRNYFVLLTDSIKHFGFFLSILIVSNDHTCAKLKSNLKIRVFSDKCQFILGLL